MAESSRLNQLQGSIGERTNFPSGPFVVALSGGADSGALAYLAVQTGIPVSCIHVHHSLPASDVLADSALEIARAIGVPCSVSKVLVPEGPSVENQARLVRYEAIGSATAPDVSVLTGHTRNDQAETVLMNVIRGAGSRGISGIPYHRPPNIFRPLLNVSRAETRELAELAELPFSDDPVNDDDKIRRNTIRSEVIPGLEKLNPNLVGSLARLAEQVGDDDDFLQSLAKSVPISCDESGASVPIGMVLVLPVPLQARVLRLLVAAVRSPEGATSAELERMRQVLEGFSAAAQLEHNLRVSRDGPLLRIQIAGPGEVS